MRLRPLTEAECYVRCYGGRREERITSIRVLRSRDRRRAAGVPLAELLEDDSPRESDPEAG